MGIGGGERDCPDADEDADVAALYEERLQVAAEDVAEVLALVVVLLSASLALLRLIVRKWNRRRQLENPWLRR